MRSTAPGGLGSAAPSWLLRRWSRSSDSRSPRRSRGAGVSHDGSRQAARSAQGVQDLERDVARRARERRQATSWPAAVDRRHPPHPCRAERMPGALVKVCSRSSTTWSMCAATSNDHSGGERHWRARAASFASLRQRARRAAAHFALGQAVIAEMEERETRDAPAFTRSKALQPRLRYYIEISKANLHLVPPDYHRKQKLPAGRFITRPQRVRGEGARSDERSVDASWNCSKPCGCAWRRKRPAPRQRARPRRP